MSSEFEKYHVYFTGDERRAAVGHERAEKLKDIFEAHGAVDVTARYRDADNRGIVNARVPDEKVAGLLKAVKPHSLGHGQRGLGTLDIIS